MTGKKYAFIVMAMSMLGAQRSHAGPLDSAISLTELRSGEANRDIPKDKALVRVDINSTIKVSFSTGAISYSIPSSSVGSAERKQTAEKIKALMAGLETWSKALVQGWEGAQQLTKLSKSDSQYDSISERTNKGYSAFFSGYKQYEKALQNIPGGHERAITLRAEINDALDLSMVEAIPKITRHFSVEIAWLNGQIADLADEALQNGSPIAVKMAAQFTHKGASSPMHLPGYDDNQPGNMQPYQKVYFEPTAQDKQTLSEINQKATALADQLREAKTLQRALVVFGQQQAAQSISDTEKAVSHMDAVIKSLQFIDWEAKKQTAENAISVQIHGMGAAAEQDYKSLIGATTGLVEIRRQIGNSIYSVESTITSIKYSIADVENAKARGKSDEVLLNVLSIASNVEISLDTTTTAVNSIIALLHRNDNIERAISAKINELPKEAKANLETVISQLMEPQASQIKSAISDFQTALNSLKGLKNTLSGQFGGGVVAASGVDIPDIDSAKLIPLEAAGGTTINILEAGGREEGDRINYRAALYKVKRGPGDAGFVPDGQPLDEYNLSMELGRFGLYSSPGGGVVFVTRFNNDLDPSPVRGQPSPSLTWMLHYRQWPSPKNDDGCSSWALSPAIGLHTTTLQFAGNGVEVGMGVTLSFFNDLIQAGYGWDMNVDTRPHYWYVGLGVLSFGKDMGVKK